MRGFFYGICKMIRISLGNVGSGKSVSEVRELYHDKSDKITYTNIKTTLPNCKTLTPQMLVIKTEDKKGNFSYEVNEEFWQKVKKPLNIYIDESHNLIDSRASLTKLSKTIMKWQSAIRRVIGEDEGGNVGELVYITQILESIDIRTRSLCTQLRYHVCYYMKRCLQCGVYWQESSEMPEKKQSCPSCFSFKLKKYGHVIYVFRFSSIENYNAWRLFGQKTYYARYFINDIENYFHLYKSLQWENLFKGY